MAIPDGISIRTDEIGKIEVSKPVHIGKYGAFTGVIAKAKEDPGYLKRQREEREQERAEREAELDALGPAANEIEQVFIAEVAADKEIRFKLLGDPRKPVALLAPCAG